jgi:hypothetical protein
MAILPQNFTGLRSLFYNNFVTQKCFIDLGNKGCFSTKVGLAIACTLISFFVILLLFLLTEILNRSVFAFLSFKSNESSNRSD